MSQDKYRITKLSKDNFIIEMLVERTTGLFWWKKTVTEWVHVNEFGYKFLEIFKDTGFMTLARTSFKSKKKANKVLKRLNNND
jgi:hypothetical protein